MWQPTCHIISNISSVMSKNDFIDLVAIILCALHNGCPHYAQPLLLVSLENRKIRLSSLGRRAVAKEERRIAFFTGDK